MSLYQKHWIYRIHVSSSVNSLFKEYFLDYTKFVRKTKEKEKRKEEDGGRRAKKKFL